VVNVTDPYGRILVFLDRSRYFFFQAEAEWTPTAYFSCNAQMSMNTCVPLPSSLQFRIQDISVTLQGGLFRPLKRGLWALHHDDDDEKLQILVR
jgi:hypothetical protein